MVEAAGIEPGQLDDLDAASPRHLAQVRDPPKEMSSPRALSRATKPSPADTVDQRDHGGVPFLMPIPLRNPASRIDRRRLHRRRLRLDVHRTERETGRFLDESRGK